MILYEHYDIVYLSLFDVFISLNLSRHCINFNILLNILYTYLMLSFNFLQNITNIFNSLNNSNLSCVHNNGCERIHHHISIYFAKKVYSLKYFEKHH